MGILATCPACGLASAEIRCPRCNALKVVGLLGLVRAVQERLRDAIPVRRSPSDGRRERMRTSRPRTALGRLDSRLIGAPPAEEYRHDQPRTPSGIPVPPRRRRRHRDRRRVPRRGCSASWAGGTRRGSLRSSRCSLDYLRRDAARRRLLRLRRRAAGSRRLAAARRDRRARVAACAADRAQPRGDRRRTCSACTWCPSSAAEGSRMELMSRTDRAAPPSAERRSSRLHASDLGRPLYERMGFTLTSEMRLFTENAPPVGVGSAATQTTRD